MARDTLHRTQISLETWQYHYLVERARRSGSSLSDIIRKLVTQAAGAELQMGQGNDPLFSIIAMAEGDGSPAGREHDHILYGSISDRKE